MIFRDENEQEVQMWKFTSVLNIVLIDHYLYSLEGINATTIIEQTCTGNNNWGEEKPVEETEGEARPTGLYVTDLFKMFKDSKFETGQICNTYVSANTSIDYSTYENRLSI